MAARSFTPKHFFNSCTIILSFPPSLVSPESGTTKAASVCSSSSSTPFGVGSSPSGSSLAGVMTLSLSLGAMIAFYGIPVRGLAMQSARSNIVVECSDEDKSERADHEEASLVESYKCSALRPRPTHVNNHCSDAPSNLFSGAPKSAAEVSSRSSATVMATVWTTLKTLLKGVGVRAQRRPLYTYFR